MPDKEKVMEALSCRATDPVRDCVGCIYKEKIINRYGCNYNQICADALALLKEQEPIAPKLEQESMVCGVCGHDVIWQKMLGDNMWHDDYLNFCPNCGRAVKWG